jgi:hypothetical protein
LLITLTVAWPLSSVGSAYRLTALADKILLNLWTYPNLYKVNGQELCDVLETCGDDVLIFSDIVHRLDV